MSENELLQHYLEHSPVAVIEWDAEFRLIRWSGRSEEMFGWKREEVLGKHPSDFRFVHEDDAARVANLMQGLSTQKIQGVRSDNRNYTKDGRIIHCRWSNSVVLDAEGKILSVLSLVSDESEVIAVREKLEREGDKLQLALDVARMGVWEWDIVLGKLNWTKRMKEMFGYDEKNFPETVEAMNERLPTEDGQKLWSAVEKSLADKTDYVIEHRVILPDGEVRWLLGNGRPFCDESGRVVRLAGTAIDITSRKRVEEELRGAKHAAEEANALKSAFLATMSHEIRTPLGVVLGFADLLSNPDIAPEERKVYAEKVNRNGRHLSRLIEDILDLSKVEAGRLDLQTRIIDVRDVIEGALAPWRERALQKGITFTEDIDETLPVYIDSDPVRISQIVINLVGNAVKFTDEGSVSVRASSLPGWISIEVGDSGIGITEEGKQRLFQMFVQADRSLTRRFGGTGLGLALSRRLARGLGGDVELVRSALGQGSVFRVSLPTGNLTREQIEQAAASAAVQAQMTATQGAKLASSKEPLRGLKILVAEDSNDTRALMERLLTRRGAEVRFAFDGFEAITKAQHDEWHVVLMDIQMPRLDGYAAIRELRANGFDRPVIALTAHAMREERERCLAAGANDHLSKPVDPNLLAQSILRLVDGHPL